MHHMISDASRSKRIPNTKTGSDQERDKQQEGAAARVLLKITQSDLRWMSHV